MGNITVSIKRFLGNKNTVTILGILLGIVVIYVGYNWRVKQAIEPVAVPFAKVEIVANSKILKEQVGTIRVSKSFVNQTTGLVTSMQKILNSYVSYDTKIPAGSLFYESQLMEKAQMPNYITENLEECHTLYRLSVDMKSTYANSIMPGDYIDLFMSAQDGSTVILGKIIESIKVLDVRDSQGIPVFSSQSTSKVPAELLFSVPNDMFMLLTRADNIKSNSIKIFPVPRNKEYTDNPSATQVASTELVRFIEDRSTVSASYSEIDQKCLNK